MKGQRRSEYPYCEECGSTDLRVGPVYELMLEASDDQREVFRDAAWMLDGLIWRAWICPACGMVGALIDVGASTF